LEYVSIDYVVFALQVPDWAKEMLREDAGWFSFLCREYLLRQLDIFRIMAYRKTYQQPNGSNITPDPFPWNLVS
jgi:hypothetical protein